MIIGFYRHQTKSLHFKFASFCSQGWRLTVCVDTLDFPSLWLKVSLCRFVWIILHDSSFVNFFSSKQHCCDCIEMKKPSQMPQICSLAIVLLYFIHCSAVFHPLFCYISSIVLLYFIHCSAIFHPLFCCISSIVLLYFIHCSAIFHPLFCCISSIVLLYFIHCSAIFHPLFCYCSSLVLLYFIHCSAVFHPLFCCISSIVLLFFIHCSAIFHPLFCYISSIVLLFFIHCSAIFQTITERRTGWSLEWLTTTLMTDTDFNDWQRL